MRGAIAPLLTLWSWLRAAVGFGRERGAAEPSKGAIVVCSSPEGPHFAAEPAPAQLDEPAQLEDHPRPATRRPNSKDLSPAQLDDRGPPAARLLGGPRIDGGTSWTIRAGPGGFACWRELVKAAKAGRGVVEWPDPWGEVVTLALERGARSYVLQTGRVRIEIWGGRAPVAEVQITAEAAEVEGVESWYLREMPRAVWWLLGKSAMNSANPFVSVTGAGAMVEQRRIEICLDVAGWQLQPGDERRMVSPASCWSNWRDENTLDGFGAGQRHKTPSSLGVYDKIAELGRQRGPGHAGMLRRWDDYGRGPDEPVTRIELRLWGSALRMVGEDGEQLDATHPGAALDGELLGKLWADGLQKHRHCRELGFARLRDDKEGTEIWQEARAAGGHVEAVRLRRDVAARQLDATRRHALERLGRAGADVEILLGGDGDGAAVLDALDTLISSPGWDSDIGRARARFADLLEQARGEP